VPLKIAFREYGQGPVVICLHGYAGGPRHWDEIVPHLSQKFRVIVPNLSHLSLAKEKISFSAQLEILASFIKIHFPQTPVRLLGISFGAALAWGLAIRSPSLVDQVVVINPLPPFPVHSMASMSLRAFLTFELSARTVFWFFRTPLGEAFLRKTARVFRNMDSPSSDDRLTHLQDRKLLFASHLFHRFCWLVQSEEWAAWERKLEFWTHDCLLIYDSQDPIFSEDTYLQFADLISCDSILRTEGRGHISVLNADAEISTAVQRFFGKDLIKRAG
jgi:pimeloyl-ACP methyl ester carboxylesterase